MISLRPVVGMMLLIGACDSPSPFAPSEPLGSAEIHYGTDDRAEWFETSDPAALAVADATMVMFSNQFLTSLANGDTRVNTSVSMGDYYEACPSEPYRDQPVPGECTAFLVGEDLAVTAGHCISNNDCASQSFVFGFKMEGPSDLRDEFPPQDVYACDQVIARSNTWNLDYAVVRLDRPVTGHQPLDIRRTGSVPLGTQLVVAGHPLGLPLKIATNATVRANRATNYFQTNADVYEGNSGSPVVNASTLQVEGILVNGNDDWQRSGNCYVTNVCPDSGCPSWEEATRTTIFESIIPPLNPSTSSLTLDGDSQVAAGQSYTWTMQGTANERFVLVTGQPGGSTSVPGCSTASIPATNLRVLGSVVSDNTGSGSITNTIPAGLAGSQRTFWAVERATCTVSSALDVTIQ